MPSACGKVIAFGSASSEPCLKCALNDSQTKIKAASPISTKVMVVVTREEYKVFIVGRNGGFGESYYTESFGIGNPVAF